MTRFWFVFAVTWVLVLSAVIVYLAVDRPTIADLVLDEAPCVVQAVGTEGTEEGLDQLEENVLAAEGDVQIARGNGYIAVVAVKCETDEMEYNP